MATQPHIDGIQMVGLKAEKNVTIRDRVVAFFCSPYLFMKELSDTFGLRFIISLFIIQHVGKGFMQGWMQTPASYLFRDLKIKASRMQQLQAVSGSAWSLKPLVGIFSDLVSVYGFNKVPYMISTTCAALVALIVLVIFWPLHPFMLTLLLFIFAFHISLNDLLTEAKYSEKIKVHSDKGPGLTSFVWGGIFFAGLMATLSVGPLLTIGKITYNCSDDNTTHIINDNVSHLLNTNNNVSHYLNASDSHFNGTLLAASSNMTSDVCTKFSRPWIYLFAFPLCCLYLIPLIFNWIQDGIREEDRNGRVGDDVDIELDNHVDDVPNSEKHVHFQEDKDAEQVIYEDVSLKYSCNTTSTSSEDLTSNTYESYEDDMNEDDMNEDDMNNDHVINIDAQQPKKSKRAIPRVFKLLCQNRFIYVNAQLLMNQWKFVALALIMVLVCLTLAIMTLLNTSKYIVLSVALTCGFIQLVSFYIFTNPVIAKVQTFFFLSNLCSVSIDSAAFYFFTDNEAQFPGGPHFSEFFYLSVIGTVASVCSILGVIIYNCFMKEWKYRHIFIGSNTLLILVNLLNIVIFKRWNKKIGIPDAVFVLGGNAFQQVVASWTWIPGVILLSHLCPNKMEAIMYSLLAGSSNLGSNIAGHLGAVELELLGIRPDGSHNETAQFDNLWIASLISTLLPLIPLCLVWFLIPDFKQTDYIRLDDNGKIIHDKNNKVNIEVLDEKEIDVEEHTKPAE